MKMIQRTKTANLDEPSNFDGDEQRNRNQIRENHKITQKSKEHIKGIFFF